MKEPDNTFYKIIKEIPNGVKGKMFGAECIKSINGKTAAFYWKGNMVFKLDEKNHEGALRINGAKIGSHLYAPERQMKGWISIPKEHSDKWNEFTKMALDYVSKLK
jgi:hypothetical protein